LSKYCEKTDEEETQTKRNLQAHRAIKISAPMVSPWARPIDWSGFRECYA
jgi:hypothetical protein